MNHLDSSRQEINNRKIIPWLSELAHTKCLAVRDWFEDHDSHYKTADTHDYGTKILLINRLHNQ